MAKRMPRGADSPVFVYPVCAPSVKSSRSWKVGGSFARLLIRHPVCKHLWMTSSALQTNCLCPSTTARFRAWRRTVADALARLRLACDQQLTSSTQCCTIMPRSLAYTSQSTRQGFVLHDSSIWPCCFHSLNSNSICQRQRAITWASATVSNSAGTLVTYSVHSVRVQQSGCG